jgi:uncharacterized membrane protein YedE/YeeE
MQREWIARLSEAMVGLLFGWGLLLAGMTDPGKVMGFLDLFGRWDPSLALVMGGAIGVALFAFLYAKKRTHSFLGGLLHLPRNDRIQVRLVLGALIFGVGWGLAGFCPGPGLVTTAMGEPKAVVFVLSMIAGMWLFAWVDRRLQSATTK